MAFRPGRLGVPKSAVQVKEGWKALLHSGSYGALSRIRSARLSHLPVLPG